MKNKNYLQTATVITLTGIFFFTSQIAHALGLVTITVKNPDPQNGNYSWFVYENKPGTVIEDIATIRNVGTQPTSVKIYAVDASSNEAGSFTLSSSAENQQNIGLWTDISSGTVELNPEQNIDIPFKITIPENAGPGQYTGGIVVEPSDKNDGLSPLLGSLASSMDNNSSSGAVSVKTRIGTRIYLTIPGNIIEKIKLVSVSASKDLNGQTRFHFEIANDGNVTYEPTAHIEIYDSFGNLYETIDQKLGTSSPNTLIKPSLKMAKSPLLGNFKSKITVSYDCLFKPTDMHKAPLTENREISFWVMPWELIFGTMLLFFGITAVILKKRMSRTKYFKNSEEYTVNETDDLLAIAAERNTSWKIIAYYNGLTPPYIIKPGTIIKIPKKKE